MGNNSTTSSPKNKSNNNMSSSNITNKSTDEESSLTERRPLRRRPLQLADQPNSTTEDTPLTGDGDHKESIRSSRDQTLILNNEDTVHQEYYEDEFIEVEDLDLEDLDETTPLPVALTTRTSRPGLATTGASSLDRSTRSANSIRVDTTPTQTDIQAVHYLRVVVFGVLIASATVVAILVYLYTDNAETESFQAASADHSAKVLEAVASTLYLSLGAIDTYVVSVVSSSKLAGMEWPFVTLPDIAVRLSKVKSISKAVVIQQSHFVSTAERDAWESYTRSNDAWVTESILKQNDDPNYDGRPWTPGDYDAQHAQNNIIHSFQGNATGPGPFLPTWQCAPVVPVYSVYNWNALYYTSVSDALPELLGAHHRVVISKVSNVVFDNDQERDNAAREAEVWAANDYIKDFVNDAKDDPLEPFSVINYPILADAAEKVQHHHGDTTNQVDGMPLDFHETTEIVGLITMMFYWRDLITDILPTGSDGTTVVFDNACGQSFTYMIFGPTVEYQGIGDLHDPRYNHLEEALDFSTELAQYTGNSRRYTGLPLGGEECGYRIRVYPSSVLEEDHTTNRPMVYTVSALLIFVFTTLVFVFYDNCVERRQRLVVSAVKQSSVNVSLLERMVKERTSKLEQSNTKLEEANHRVTRASAAQLEHFACMSHEIRTPLNCVIGVSSLLLESDLTPMQEESMRMIVSSGDLLLTVVNDVLDYSKLESGNVEIAIHRGNLQETLNAVVHSIETRAAAKQLKVRTIYDPNIPEFIHMDSRRLQQICYNLLGNSLKFSNEGGTIDLTVSLLPPRGTQREGRLRRDSRAAEEKDAAEIVRTDNLIIRERSISKETSHRSRSFILRSIVPAGSLSQLETKPDIPPGTRMIRFSVHDRGKGIDAKDIKKIFEPFRQASAETERVYGGTGLGLAVTARLVGNLGGRISVDSEVGKWSRFTVDLPFRDTPVVIDELRQKLAMATVLIIDNDDNNSADVLSIFSQFQLDCKRFKSMSEMLAAMATVGFLRPDRTYICLVHEKLYQESYFLQLSKATKAVLVSHGPKFAVKESRAHYRSLTHVLPSVLMESFATLIHEPPTPAADASAPASEPCIVDHHSIEKLRILIAEDNKINVKVLSRILSRLGIENITVVGNGLLAVEAEADQPFDVIMMDVQMPIMEGTEACREIQKRDDTIVGTHPKPKIIFVTAHVSDAFEAECNAAGGSGFLPKPFSIGDIENCLQNLRISTATATTTTTAISNDILLASPDTTAAAAAATAAPIPVREDNAKKDINPASFLPNTNNGGNGSPEEPKKEEVTMDIIEC